MGQTGFPGQAQFLKVSLDRVMQGKGIAPQGISGMNEKMFNRFFDVIEKFIENL